MKNKTIIDPMMDEIHKVRERHYNEGKKLSLVKRLQALEDKSREFLSSYGYKLIPTDHGTQRLVKV